MACKYIKSYLVPWLLWYVMLDKSLFGLIRGKLKLSLVGRSGRSDLLTSANRHFEPENQKLLQKLYFINSSIYNQKDELFSLTFY